MTDDDTPESPTSRPAKRPADRDAAPTTGSDEATDLRDGSASDSSDEAPEGFRLVTREDLGQQAMPLRSRASTGTALSDTQPRSAPTSWEPELPKVYPPLKETRRPERREPVVAEGHDPEAGEAFDPRDYVRLPRRSGSMRRFAIVAAVLLLAGIYVYRAANDWVDGQISPAGPWGEDVEFAIEDGWTLNRIAEELDSTGVITNSTVFRYWCNRQDDCGDFQAGDYTLNLDMDFQEAVDRLNEGPRPITFFDVLVQEGLTLDEIRTRLIAENPEFDPVELNDVLDSGRLESALVPTDRLFLVDGFRHLLEGMLFPATYDILSEKSGDEFDLLSRMVRTMEDRVATISDEVGLPPEADELGLTEYDMIIIASLIEEEAKIDADRPKIARVIFNRLLNGESLGIDATTRYAVNKTPAEPLLQSELDSASPYNTRNLGIIGLPPTPIAAPGEASLRAAFGPEAGEWLFYALTNEDGVEGAHAFANTLDEHNANVARCRELGLCGL